MKKVEVSESALESIKAMAARLYEENEALRAVLTELDSRLRRCSGEPISAAEAYDSFYQQMVLNVLKG